MNECSAPGAPKCPQEALEWWKRRKYAFEYGHLSYLTGCGERTIPAPVEKLKIVQVKFAGMGGARTGPTGRMDPRRRTYRGVTSNQSLRASDALGGESLAERTSFHQGQKVHDFGTHRSHFAPVTREFVTTYAGVERQSALFMQRLEKTTDRLMKSGEAAQRAITSGFPRSRVRKSPSYAVQRDHWRSGGTR